MERMQLAGTARGEWSRVNMLPLRYLREVYPDINAHIVKGGDMAIMERIGENVVEYVFGNPETAALKRAVKKVRSDGTTAI